MSAQLPIKNAIPLTSHPRIYYVHPLLLDSIDAWQEVFEHARSMGFDTILTAPLYKRGNRASIFVSSAFDEIDPRLGLGTDLHLVVRNLTEKATTCGLSIMLDLTLGLPSGGGSSLDPRVRSDLPASVRNDSSEALERTLETWRPRINSLAAAGVRGFRCLKIEQVPGPSWKKLIGQAQGDYPDISFLAWTPGTAFETRRGLVDVGFKGSFSSSSWWDFEERWLLDEHEVQRDLGFEVAFPEAPFHRRAAHGPESLEVRKRRSLRSLRFANSFGGALMVPMGFEFGNDFPLDPFHGDGKGLDGLRRAGSFDITDALRIINTAEKDVCNRRFTDLIVDSGQMSVALIEGDRAGLQKSEKARVVIVNRDLRSPSGGPVNAINLALSRFLPLVARPEGNEKGLPPKLQPGEVVVLHGQLSKPVMIIPFADEITIATASPRLAIEKITPAVDDGLFPVKRVVGETLDVEADILCDGHDPLAASVLWRAIDENEWSRIGLELISNDRWSASIPLERLGRHEFVIEAWRSPFAIYHYELDKKHAAGLNLALELQEGRNIVNQAYLAADAGIQKDLAALLTAFDAGNSTEQAKILLSAESFELMAKADQRPFAVRSSPYGVEVERTGASFASWYQIFPRSQSGDPHRHGTFDDVISRLPAIKDMGFDVLYFPPIHPIGTTNRKGRNNTLRAAPNDPGSPYAIGSDAGGHDAIHPELGDFGDFRRLIGEAKSVGLEIALDLAIQASPDHPWLREHPGWFDWRPDGTVRYAENPPKKYEDIVNVDFYAKDATPGLWQELQRVVQLWVDQGVKIFRVDNPHTKPFPFWQWLIADIRAKDPNVIFLSEAFTKPKVMYRLAKVGFSQSYTYFTWRNEKWEIERYMREITTEEPKEFFRPHFFVNTHDINPDFLQNAPRSAYLIRAALAATLSGLWGVYNGFELCEGRPDAKRKEYADSEKYEIRAWDWDRPGNIKAEIKALNTIRKQNTSLHSHLGLTLLPASNTNVVFFEKASPGRENVLLVAISLDPHHAQETELELPFWSWKLPDSGTLVAEDLLNNRKLSWTGKWQHIRLDPAHPFAIWRIRQGN